MSMVNFNHKFQWKSHKWPQVNTYTTLSFSLKWVDQDQIETPLKKINAKKFNLK